MYLLVRVGDGAASDGLLEGFTATSHLAVHDIVGKTGTGGDGAPHKMLAEVMHHSCYFTDLGFELAELRSKGEEPLTSGMMIVAS